MVAFNFVPRDCLLFILGSAASSHKQAALMLKGASGQRDIKVRHQLRYALHFLGDVYRSVLSK